MGVIASTLGVTGVMAPPRAIFLPGSCIFSIYSVLSINCDVKVNKLRASPRSHRPQDPTISIGNFIGWRGEVHGCLGCSYLLFSDWETGIESDYLAQSQRLPNSDCQLSRLMVIADNFNPRGNFMGKIMILQFIKKQKEKFPLYNPKLDSLKA